MKYLFLLVILVLAGCCTVKKCQQAEIESYRNSVCRKVCIGKNYDAMYCENCIVTSMNLPILGGYSEELLNAMKGEPQEAQ